MWTNAPLVVYHGTDEHSANTISGPSGISLAACRSIADFGRGFYVTSIFDAAKYWADQKVRHLPSTLSIRAAVLVFDLNLNIIAELDDHLTFVLSTPEFFNFVTHNRSNCSGNPDHARSGNDPRTGEPISPYYDVVYGPVARDPFPSVYHDYDQICFLNEKALAALGKPRGTIFPP
jgi:hypothetical protein